MVPVFTSLLQFNKNNNVIITKVFIWYVTYRFVFVLYLVISFLYSCLSLNVFRNQMFLFTIMVLSHIRQFLPIDSKRGGELKEKSSLKRKYPDDEDHLKKPTVNDVKPINQPKNPAVLATPSGKGLTIKLSQPVPVSEEYFLKL